MDKKFKFQLIQVITAMAGVIALFGVIGLIGNAFPGLSIKVEGDPVAVIKAAIVIWAIFVMPVALW